MVTMGYVVISKKKFEQHTECWYAPDQTFIVDLAKDAKDFSYSVYTLEDAIENCGGNEEAISDSDREFFKNHSRGILVSDRDQSVLYSIESAPTEFNAAVDVLFHDAQSYQIISMARALQVASLTEQEAMRFSDTRKFYKEIKKLMAELKDSGVIPE